MDNDDRSLPEDKWIRKLTPEQYKIAKEKGTERPFSGKYLLNHQKGMYICAACGNELFSSDTKFDSNTGWPAFSNPVNLENIRLSLDDSHGMARTEVSCAKCNAHLGHLFDYSTGNKKDMHYCINSTILDFKEVK